jgi:mannosyltransferase
VVVAAVLAGTGLRLWGLGAQSLWYDEWLTAESSHGSASDLFRYVTDQAGIPPLYFAVMWVWTRVFGLGEVALRIVSVGAGVATIPVAYATVRALGQRRAVARAAAVLVAVNPMLVWYSQEARPYSLVALMGALSLLMLARVWTRDDRRDLAVWALVCALTISLHYFAAFLVVAEVAVVAAFRQQRWRGLGRRELLATFWPAGVVLAALAPFAVRQFTRRGNHSWITNFSLSGRLEDTGQLALVGPGAPDRRLWMVAAGVVALAMLLLATRAQRGERRGAAAAGGLATASVLLGLAAAAVGEDVIVARYFIVALVPLVVAVAIGLFASRAPRWVGPAAVAVLGATSVVAVVAVTRDPLLQRADWQAVAAAHEAGDETGPRARLLVLSIEGTMGRPVQWYLDGERPLGRDETVVVDEIDVVVTQHNHRPCSHLAGLTCNLVFLGWGRAAPLVTDFAVEEQIQLDQFAIDRFRAPEPVAVSLDDIVVPEYDKSTLVLVTVDE